MLRIVGVALLVVGPAAIASAQPTLHSTGLAKELTSTLAAQRLDAIAARDPSEPDRFVAALFYPGAQLLVVSARYAAPSLLQSRLSQKQYKDVYLDLQGSSIPNSTWFLQDMNADGLCAGRDDAADILYSKSPTPAIFDGDWRKHNLSEHDYQQLLSAADDQYSRLLQALLTQLHGT